MRAFLVLACSAWLAGCAGQAPREAPPGSLTVATVRHASGPEPAVEWLDDTALPPGAVRSDGGRAALLEVAATEGIVTNVEAAPLELANLVVRFESRDDTQSVVAVENRSDATLAYALFLSPDGRRWRRVATCAVAAGTTAYERWPGRSTWFAVADVQEAAPTEESCR